ncbi:cysteine-rich CWC family protein [Paenibacillus thermotolerans]|uniref:cysteine-rich CWC family protein n=1 Tax=Paenibacillus thermotolerans TaxID=3027807 RepID=UPI0030823192
MNRDETVSADQRCPLCNEGNDCNAGSGNCWCFHIKVPMELRKQIPEELRGKACICRHCVEKFVKE